MAIEGITSAALYAQHLLRRPQGSGKDLTGDTPGIDMTPTPPRARRLPPPMSYDNTPGFGSGDVQKIDVPKTGMNGGSVGPPSYGGGEKDLGSGDIQNQDVPKTGMKWAKVHPPLIGDDKDLGSGDIQNQDVPKTGMKWTKIGPPPFGGDLGSGGTQETNVVPTIIKDPPHSDDKGIQDGDPGKRRSGDQNVFDVPKIEMDARGSQLDVTC